MKLQRKQLKYTFAEEFLRVVIVILCIAYTASQVMVGRITIGGLSVTFGLIINLVYSMQRITKNLATIYTHTADIAQFYEFMDMEEEAKDSPKVKPEKSDFNIILKNVSYAYPFSDAQVIKKINLNIKSGSHVAVVGDMSARLQLQLYRPQKIWWHKYNNIWNDNLKENDKEKYNSVLNECAILCQIYDSEQTAKIFSEKF